MKATLKTTALVILLLLAASAPHAHAQDGRAIAFKMAKYHQFADIDVEKPLQFKRLTTEDGLSFPNVYAIVQDRQGFLWFATKYGLNKYDGMDFAVFTHDPENTNSLSDNYAWKLMEDSGGFLWISTWGGGLNRFDPATDTFTRYQHDPDDTRSLSSDFVAMAYEDRGGNLWVATAAGLNRFDPDTESFTRYVHNSNNPNSLSHDEIESMVEDSQGYLWLGTFGGGLNRFDPQTEAFIHFRYQDDDPHSLSFDKINALLIDDQNTLWIGTNNGLNALALPTSREQAPSSEFTRYLHDSNDVHSLSHDRVRALYQDTQGVLWIGTNGGLNRYNRTNNNFAPFLANNDDPYSLSHNSVYFVTEDEAGALWIGTANGVSIADPGSQRFELVMRGSQIQAVGESQDGTLWVGTGGSGLALLERTDSIPSTDSPLNLSGTVISQILPTEDGVLWVSTLDGGLNKCDPIAGHCDHYRHDPANPDGLVSNAIMDIGTTPEGIIWIALSGDGLASFDPQQESFIHYTSDGDDPNTISSIWARTVLVDSSGMVWVGTEGGVSRFDPSTETFTNYVPQRDNPDSLSNAVVNMICESADRTLWIATNDGLNKLDPATDTFQVYRSRDGLPGNSIAAIIEDEDGSLWVSTNNGISRFDPRRETFRNYDELDGLQGKQFIYHSAYRTQAGEIFFGGSNGLNAFYPDKLFDNPYRPPVFLTEFRLLNEPVSIADDSPLSEHINFTEEITLSRDQSSIISFEFAALNYRAPQKNRYAYILEGFDKDWTYTDSSQRTARYTNLDPGSYTFRVIASNNDGLWNESGTAVTIVITPAWWETWWFRGVVLMLVIGFVVAGVWGRTYSVERRNRQLEKKVATRTRDLQESEARFRGLSESTLEGIVIHEKGTILDFNQAAEALFGYSRVELIGKQAKELVSVESWDTTVQRSIQSESEEPYEAVGLRQDGSTFPMEIHAKMIPYGNRRVRVVAVRDTSQRKESEARLREAKEKAEAANQAKSTFLANMSHELRTPLNAILGYTQLMARDVAVTPTHKEYLRTVARSGEHLLGLINDVLTMSKIEAGFSLLQENAFDLHRQLRSLLEIFQLRAAEKGVALCLDIAADVPQYINADEGKLRQVLTNLISNAVKFTHEGRVALFVRCEDPKRGASPALGDSTHIIFEIEDTGIGIASEEKAVIFEPFVQTTSGQQSQVGTGLGLPISQHFVNLMGGLINVESAVGQGTSIRVQIPVTLTGTDTLAVINAGSQRQVAGIEPGQTSPDGSPFRLLIVDDDADSRELLIKLLEPFGFSLRSAVNGKDGLELWEAWQPHLVWMDMRMPVMDGYEAARQIKAHAKSAGQQTVIVAVTATAFEEDRRAVFEAGCDDFVRKPFGEDEICYVLHRQLGVRFIFDTFPAVLSTNASVHLEALRATIAALPDTWATDLYQAAVALDIDRMLALVEAVRPQAPNLCDLLEQWVRDFEYDRLMALVTPRP